MDCGISSKMLKMIIVLYTNVTSCVNRENSIADEFPCEFVPCQGDSLFPILFHCLLMTSQASYLGQNI